jgi:putative sigma-54 modulation protein
MDTHISGRGIELSPALRRRVETKVAKVSRFLTKIVEVRVVLGLERHRHLAEVTLQAKGATLHAEGAAGDFYAAVDLAVESLARQARRRKDRLRTRKPRSSRPAPATRGVLALAEPTRPAPEGAEASEAPEVVIRRLSAKPMSFDEALEQMRSRPDSLLVFTDARSRLVNVLHRRPDGLLELVQPTG